MKAAHSARQAILGALDAVQEAIHSKLQNMEDELLYKLHQEEIELAEETKRKESPALNFDADSQDEVDAYDMAFEQKQRASTGAGKSWTTQSSSSSEKDSVPQSPPSQSTENNSTDAKTVDTPRDEEAKIDTTDSGRSTNTETAFDPIGTLEVFFDRLQERLTPSRTLLRIAASTFVWLNILAFLALFFSKSLPLMAIQHPLYYTFLYSLLVLVGSIHCLFVYEKARRTDAGTPEKISLAHAQGTLGGYERITVEELRTFTPAFRNLLAYRNKGYISLMHVQAQFSQAQHEMMRAYESSTDEECNLVTMGGLQCCTECEHRPIKPLRTEHCTVCDQDTILSDGHSYLIDNCIGINNRRYYLMLWATITFLLMMAVYPLNQLSGLANPGLRMVASTQLIVASLGSILAFFYTLFLWYAALTGLYRVDTFSKNNLIKEHPRRKLQRAEKMALREQFLVVFGTTDFLEILDTWQYDNRPLPLKGLEWTFLQSEGGITTSDEDDEEFERLL